MSLSLDPLSALVWVTRLAACGVLIDSLEKLFCWPVFHDTGVLGWPWLRQRRGFLQRRYSDAVLRFPNYLGVLVMRASAALVLIVTPVSALLGTLGLLLLVVTGMLVHVRSSPYGIDGAQRMTLIICGALLLRRIVPDSLIVAQATLWFLAIQTCVSYATSGLAKMKLPEWQQGSGVYSILNVPYIGSEALARWLHGHPRLSKTVTWLTLGMECAFPLVLVVGYPANLLFLGWGVLFHLTNAMVLGLNTFVWAWVATYPAIVVVTAWGQ